MNIEQIKKLVEKFPNNMELGNAVRRIYWEAKEKEEAKDTSQLDLFEDEESRDDAILGYD
jgi:hypothetical protein|tara:strand:- start:335 stop:514 length:180 start_codon:yes stop_codon:yes gene_type:complete